MAVTIRRLAQLAGVSHVTVVRALHGQDAVSAATRNRILALAKKHNVPLPPQPAPEPRNLLKVLCSTLDIEADEPQSDQGFAHRLLTGLRRGAADCGVELLNTSWQKDAWPMPVNRAQVDGVVLALGDETQPHPLFPPPVPAVFIFCGPLEADVVTVENFDTAAMLGEHLVSLGHRRVAYMGPRTNMSHKRLSGLRFALEEAGGAVPPEFVRIERGVGGREMASILTDRLLAKRRADSPASHFTALICYNDYIASQAVLRLREHGLRVPKDVSVVGFDNVRPDWYDGPALTTMSMPLEDLGAEAARLLYWRLAHPGAPRRRLVLNAPLVVGESARAVTPQKAEGRPQTEDRRPKTED